MPRLFFRLPLALIALAALWLRTHDLARRPMHADEANQAVKTGALLESGRYVFDPRDHHGPTLYYAALPVAWLRGQDTLAALDESTLRLVPAIFGTIGVVLLGLLARPLGTWPALAAAAFVALSPPAVYYSRYFIQETLLVTFTLATVLCARAWWRSAALRWAAATGVCAGLAQATKASAPLFLIAALVAAAAARCFRPPVSAVADVEKAIPARGPRRLKPALLLAFAAALLTAALLYSSFFSHPAGIVDALRAYTFGFSRLSGGATGHEKPWWYYSSLFGWLKRGGLLWQQLFFSALALAGFAMAWLRASRFVRAVAVYFAVLVIVLSAIPYKTPWHAIHFVPPAAILAAFALRRIARLPTGKLVAIPTALLVLGFLWQQTVRAAFARPADERNPWAYVHSAPDVLKFRPLAVAALARRPGAPIRIVSEEYWPLPWYFRGLPRIGYWNTPPADCDGALVIASAGQAGAVRARLHGAYRESFLGLRPGFVCVVFTPAESP